MGKQQSTNVREFLDDKYRDYAKYTIFNRAIPSIVDGMKPSQRKILFTAMKVAKSKKVKTASLSGYVISEANFHHGVASLDDAASLMAAKWANHIPLLEGEGNFGNRLVNQAGAARYTFVKVSPLLEHIFLDTNLAPDNPDPESPEPLYYLPIIPMVLVNGANGLAVGFSTKILPRTPEGVINACMAALRGHSDQTIRKHLIPSPPMSDCITKAVDGNDEKQWVVEGKMKRTSPTRVTITEIPFGIERETYFDKVIIPLTEEGVITQSIDKCSDSKFIVELHISRKQRDISDEKLFKLLKLEKRYTENITVIDPEGELKVFPNATSLVKDFVQFRLSFYSKRFAELLRQLQNEKHKAELELRFIKDVIQNRISFVGKKKAVLIGELVKMYDISTRDADMLLNIRTYRFCEDSVFQLKERIQFLEQEIERVGKLDPMEEYLKELKVLLKKLKKAP